MTDNELPLVTVVSPCYNHSLYVIQSLESIRRQTYYNIEHIIIDDCSTDDSVQKIDEWIKANNYKCQFIKHETNKGLSYTLNESIRLAKGDYWSTLATDDIAELSRTADFIKYFQNNPGYEMVCSDCLFINKDSIVIKKNETSSFLKYHSGFRRSEITFNEFGTFTSLTEGNYIPSSLIVKKSAFKRSGMFDTDLQMEDWDMWLRISNLFPIGYIDKPLTRYRFHDTNTVSSVAFQKKYKEEVLTVLYKCKSYIKNKKLVQKINNAIAYHIYFYFSFSELRSKKNYFKSKHDSSLYQQIVLRFHFKKSILFFYKQYSKMPDNIIKKIYRSLKY